MNSVEPIDNTLMIGTWDALIWERQKFFSNSFKVFMMFFQDGYWTHVGQFS